MLEERLSEKDKQINGESLQTTASGSGRRAHCHTSSSRIARLAEQSKNLLNTALAQSTSKAYQNVWEKFSAFAQRLELPQTLPIPASHLIWFFTDLYNQGLAYTSLPPMASALSYIHKMNGAEDTPKSFRVQQLFCCLSPCETFRGPPSTHYRTKSHGYHISNWHLDGSNIWTLFI